MVASLEGFDAYAVGQPPDLDPYSVAADIGIRLRIALFKKITNTKKTADSWQSEILCQRRLGFQSRLHLRYLITSKWAYLRSLPLA